MKMIQLRTACLVVLVFYVRSISAVENFNGTNSSHYVEVTIDGKTWLMKQELMTKIELEESTWHWMPWMRTRLDYVDNIAREHEVTKSIDSFPESIWTEDQLRMGGFLLYALFGIYAFTLLAVVCNDYFIPCVELICEDLKIPQNVAAATFMSVATSCPEFFVNIISTFLTQSDMGIGTIVGSAIFNALGVAAIGGLAAVKPIAIGMRPVTRDVVIYMINVSVLVIIVWDSQVDWYEAMILAILYVCYFVLMFNSMRLFDVFDRICAKYFKKTGSETDNNITIVASADTEEGIDNKAFDENTIKVPALSTDDKAHVSDKVEAEGELSKKSVWTFPHKKSWLYKLGWLYLLPLKLIMSLTIPSPVTMRRWYPLSFIMCIVWIGINSYFVSWSMTVIGYVFLIPDSVMGMTFLAFGGCLPEAFSIYIMSRRGEGGIGVSNALGANSLAILFALGTPWLIRIIVNVAQGAETTSVYINSSGIDFIVGSLLVAVSCLWITLYIGKFYLRKSIGAVLAILYAIFITFAILVELDIIFAS